VISIHAHLATHALVSAGDVPVRTGSHSNRMLLARVYPS